MQECLRCEKTCLEAVVYREERGGPLGESNHVRLLSDCAEICRASAEVLGRGSPLFLRTYALSAEACEQAAAECEAFDEDGWMRECAEACHRCAAACRQMLSGQPPA